MPRPRLAGLTGFIAFALALAFGIASVPSPAGAALPRPAHVVVVIEENKSLAEILGNANAPYINELFAKGALFTQSYGVTHPSLPNYFALFSGLTNDNGDDCPATGISPAATNIATQLGAVNLTFAGYAEAMPSVGFRGCWAGTYARKHAPWVHFTNVPAAASIPFANFPAYDALPTLSFVIPDVNDDMHDGSIAQGDAWLRRHLGPLVTWAATHDTLLILTWDEGYDTYNHIPTAFVGPMVKPGRYAERIDHYRVLRTMEALYGLAPAARAAATQPIADCWR